MPEETETPTDIPPTSIIAPKPNDPNLVPNPYLAAGNPNIIVSMPKTSVVKWVEANALEDFETWVFYATIMSSALFGFTGAVLNSILEIKNLFVIFLLGFFAVVFVYKAHQKKNQMNTEIVSCTVYGTVVEQKKSAEH